MFKCGQKGNGHYTFGLRQEQIKEDEKEILESLQKKECCSHCGIYFDKKVNFCPNCGEKL
jgi:rRNA maturation endonuclease Nob1